MTVSSGAWRLKAGLGEASLANRGAKYVEADVGHW